MNQIVARSNTGPCRFAPALAVLAFLLAFGIASTARAGACQACQTSADCKGVSADAVCVDWMGNLSSCSGQMNCCPGQACAMNNGVASCVTSGECRMVGGGGGAPGDAGAPAASTSSDDGGCSCRVAANEAPASSAVLALVAGVLALRFRRRSRVWAGGLNVEQATETAN